jgi:hypothetical protein
VISEPISETTRWKIVIEKKEFDALKKKEEF